eukprot:325354_1
MAKTKPKKCGFRKSTMLDSAKIIHDLIIPSYFQFLEEYKWMYSSTTSRYYGISSQFSRIIEHIINQPPSYNYSHVLYDDNDFTNIIGHILLSPPHPIMGSLIPNTYEIIRDLYWKQPINHGIITMYKNYKLNKAKDLIHSKLKKYCHRYWCAEIVAIKPIWQANNYGTIMLNASHKYIKGKMSLNKMDNKVPIFVCTSTKKSQLFFRKNGYQTFIIIKMDKALDLYGMLYHYDQKIKQKWMSVLKDNVKYEMKFDVKKHMLPQTCCGWMEFIILLPFLGFYLGLCYVLRFLVC